MCPVDPPSSPRARLRLRVSPVAETRLRSGHPWLFADSIRAQNRAGEAGELGVVYDRNDAFLAIGLYDPDSPIRLRILHAGRPVTINDGWWDARLDAALRQRDAVRDAFTDGFRCINGESDGWPGLVLDVYADSVVLKLYTTAWFPHISRVAGMIEGKMNPKRIILRLSRNVQDAARRAGWADGQALVGDSPDGPVIFCESGLRFEADIVRGQKTGFFLDQRENRRLVETVARGARTLNAFSFTGGFSLYAARGGAASVTSVDISSHAMAGARRNFTLNSGEARIAQCRHEAVQADVFAWLPAAPRKSFDLVIIDPPSMARRETDRAEAVRAYQRLAAAGLGLLAPGGLLVASSCSAHVGPDEFFGGVRQAARSTGKQFTEWKTTGHAADHPARFPEGNYLKSIFLRVS